MCFFHKTYVFINFGFTPLWVMWTLWWMPVFCKMPVFCPNASFRAEKRKQQTTLSSQWGCSSLKGWRRPTTILSGRHSSFVLLLLFLLIIISVLLIIVLVNFVLNCIANTWHLGSPPYLLKVSRLQALGHLVLHTHKQKTYHKCEYHIHNISLDRNRSSVTVINKTQKKDKQTKSPKNNF